MFGSTPSELSDSYRAIATMHDAGLSLVVILDGFSRRERTELRDPARALAARLAAGSTLHDATRQLGLAAFDVAVLGAAERTGHLGAAATLLADHYAGQHATRRALVVGMIRPLLLLVAALVLLPIPRVASGSLGASRYGIGVVGALAVLAATYRLATRPRAGAQRHGTLARLVTLAARHVPLLGHAVRMLERQTLLRVMGFCVSAGLGLQAMLEAGAATVADPRSARALESTRAAARAHGLADALAAAGLLDRHALALIATGERTGTLDRALVAIADDAGAQAARSLRAFRAAVPTIAYAGIAAYVVHALLRG